MLGNAIVSTLRKLAFSRLSLLCILLTGVGQASSAPSKVVSIHTVGQQRYSEAQIIAASGLQPGEEFDANALQAAAERLGESGAFDDVEYHYRPDGAGTAVEFSVKETSKLHRCVFDNFVWYTSSEIGEYLRKQVPLFADSLPEAGTLLDEVTAALQQLLASDKIVADVERTRFGALGSATWVHVFAVSGPELKIQNVQFRGVQGIDTAILEKNDLPLVGRNYSVVQCLAFGGATFVPLYRERGFLRVVIDDPTARVLNRAAGTNQYAVEVTFPITEGLIYNWNPVQWSGDQLLAPSDLDVLMSLRRGEIADGTKIDAGWDAVIQAYGKRGYMEARVSPEPIYDDANRSVSFRVIVSEGRQYHMGTLTVTGLPAGVAQLVQLKWHLKQSDVYDSSYLHDFLNKDLPPLLASTQVHASSLDTQININRGQLTVDVSLLVK